MPATDASLAELERDLAALDLAIPDPADLDLGEQGLPAAQIKPVAALVLAEVIPGALDAREQFYSALPTDQAANCRQSAERIRNTMKGAVLEVGRELIEISDRMPGYFTRWLNLEFTMSRATAYNYINATRMFGSTPRVIEALPPGVVYKLAAEATPPEIRDAVVRAIAAGEHVSAAEVEDRIRAAKNAANRDRQAKADLVEAERLRETEDQKWRDKARGLAHAGHNEQEIAKTKKAWEGVKQRKARAQQEEAAEQQKRNDQYEANRRASEESAAKLAKLLRDSLPSETFAQLCRGVTNHQQGRDFADALSKELPGNFGHLP
jgi:hypothetical protein